MGSMISAKSFLKYSAWFFLNRKKLEQVFHKIPKPISMSDVCLASISCDLEENVTSHVMDKSSGQLYSFTFPRCDSPDAIPTQATPSHCTTDYGKSKVEFPTPGGATYRGRTSVVPLPRGRSSSHQRESCPRQPGSGAVRSSLAADCQ